ncbi:MAG: DUF1080 domain-containing protein [Phycisphaerae bacterium]|nr:DUF1080 domain-containing protein [Phycisphaerae bacterium]
MKTKRFILIAGVIVAAMLVTLQAAELIKEYKWGVHDNSRPKPKIITPGTFSTDDAVGKAPSDAIVLFDGKNLDKWCDNNGTSPSKWIIKDGVMESVKGAGYIRTKDSFGDCQLHVEWAAPSNVIGNSQGRGNSGVFLMGTYEIQVLDCYENETYADGYAAAVYGQSPPLVNACKKPGQWQTYDIIFHRPHFKDGKVVKPATVTVLHNGVLVQDHWVIEGTTWHKRRSEYIAHADALPLKFQDHGNPVRFRNVWIRPL